MPPTTNVTRINNLKNPKKWLISEKGGDVKSLLNWRRKITNVPLELAFISILLVWHRGPNCPQ